MDVRRLGYVRLCSFLAYLSYGYLDTWHGIATLFLLPVFRAGLWRSRPVRRHARDVWCPGQPVSPGRGGLYILAASILAAGATIVVVGMTRVFVPQDLVFMRLTPAELQKVSPRLVAVIAHDRAGFGGGLFSTGIILLFLARHAPLSRSLVQMVALMGLAGFGCAVGVHPAIGYTDFLHLAPAYFGALLFGATVLRLAARSCPECQRRRRTSASHSVRLDSRCSSWAYRKTGPPLSGWPGPPKRIKS